MCIQVICLAKQVEKNISIIARAALTESVRLILYTLRSLLSFFLHCACVWEDIELQIVGACAGVVKNVLPVFIKFYGFLMYMYGADNL